MLVPVIVLERDEVRIDKLQIHRVCTHNPLLNYKTFSRPFERVYLPFLKVADTPSHIQREAIHDVFHDNFPLLIIR